jgi:kynureninase
MIFERSMSFAEQLDEQDPLKEFRDKFIIPVKDGKQQIYFLGNSLGLQPKSTKAELYKVSDQWAKYGVEGFFEGTDPWMDYHDQLKGPLSKIVGALPNEVVVMNQLSVNMHLMMKSFYRPAGKRNKIICEAKAFPSDQYIFETQAKDHGLNPDEAIIEVKPREGEYTIRTEDILSTIQQFGDSTAIVLFSGINYYTGQFFDIKKITDAAHAVGATCGFDLAHAAGNVPLRLHGWDVDFACWCSYKYLNSGPGAVGAVFIHEKYHHDISIPRYAGLWGYDKATRFKMEKGFKPVLSAEGWQLSTPSMFLYAAHKAALDIFEEAGLERLEAKRKLLNGYLWFLLNELNNDSSKKFMEIITPSNEEERGCQVSMLMLQEGRKIYNELKKAGVMPDWREPNVIRLAPVPLYNSFEEVWKFVEVLKRIL